jgi:TonB family protein
MKKLCFLFLLGFTCTALATNPKSRPQYRTDSGTVGFLRRHLISGGDIRYPADMNRSRQQGSGFYLMKLRPDGAVEAVTIKSSTGYASVDEYVTRTLKDYRFKSQTKGPILWLVSFIQPATVLVQAWRYDEKNPPHLQSENEMTSGRRDH